MNYFDAHAHVLSAESIPTDLVNWSAAWCVGTAVGRSVWVAGLPTPLFLNTQIIMVSNKGFSKETIVEDMSRKIVRLAMERNVVFDSGPITTKLRQQQDLFGYGHAAFVGIDFGKSLMGKGKDIHHDLVLSPSVWDRISNPYMSVMSHVAADYIAGKRGSLTDNPYVADCIFVSRRKGIGIRKDVGSINIQSAAEELTRILEYARANAIIRLSDEAKDFLANYNRSRPRQSNSSAYERAFRTQFDTHVIRLAAIRTISKASNVVTRSEIKEALVDVLRAERYGSYIFAQASASRSTIGMEKLRANILGARPSISHTALYHSVRTWFKAYEFRGTLAIIRDAGAILSWRVSKSTGQAGYHYSATDRLGRVDVWNEILTKAGYEPEMEDEE